jgi:hypothetical protein
MTVKSEFVVLACLPILCLILLIPESLAFAPPPEWHLSQGNRTYIDKLGLPVNISQSFIEVGQNHTYIYTLNHESQYHVYFYGDWLGTKTDYDIAVYDPAGFLETYHTESYGLPEHLGTTVQQPFFKPEQDGNYSFLVINDLEDRRNATDLFVHIP